MEIDSKTFSVDPTLLAKIQQKQSERQEVLTRLKQEYTLDDNAIRIVNLPVADLLQNLKSRELSATLVLQAYMAKALEVTEKFNCVTEFIPQATAWAAALDNSSGPTRPLHGLPVAIKDDHDVEGMDTTMGFAKKLYKPAAESATLVKVLMNLGAVPFAKTNIPQSIFSNGSDNPIFGTTLNSRNVELAPGGSSSGSACIVAAGGATFATGSDLGGSLRIPSHFHGICTIKPTVNRLSDKGILQCIPKVVGQRGVPGIITRDAKTLALIWKAITDDNIQNQLDPLAVPLPWNESLFSLRKKLKVGYFTSLPFFPAFKDTQQTVLAAKEAFETLGYQTAHFEMPDSFRFMKLIFDLLLADQGKYLQEVFESEPVSYCVAGLMNDIRNPVVRPPSINGHVIQNLRGKVLSGIGADVKAPSDLWNLVYEKRMIAADLLDRMRENEIDVLLGPAFPFPAVKLHDGYGLSGGAYTAIWNFVDFPAGVIPFGTESGSNIQSYDDGGDPILQRAKGALSESAGMPINVQIIARPFMEEVVLRVMLELENIRKDTANKK